MSMEKSFNITRNELKTLISEVYRKLSYLNESVKEGGKAGHMMHPFEVDTYTFGDYKQLVRDLFNTNIEKFTEKLDGMNIYATVDLNGTVRFARNTSDVKNEFGGMDPAGMDARWGGPDRDQTVLDAYNNAYKIFSDVTRKLRNPVDFFNGEGYRIYANCEVIDARHENVIPYPDVVLSFHGLVALSNDGLANSVDLPDEIFDQKMSVLERLLPDVKSQYGNAQVTPEVVISLRENCEEAIAQYTAMIDKIEEMAGIDDNTTIIDYRAKLLPEWLADHGYQVLLNNPFTEYFIKRWVFSIKDPSIAQYKKVMKNSGIPNWQEIATTAVEFEGGFKTDGPMKMALAEIMSPVETFFYRLGNEVIAGVENYANTGREDIALNTCAERLKQTQELIASSGDIEFQNKMAKYLRKLAVLGNKYNPLEGVVFNYRGNTLKLTGSFAALNRAVNLKIELRKKQRKNQA